MARSAPMAGAWRSVSSALAGPMETATISVASEEMTYPVMAGFKWRRYFYGFNASPLSSPQIANGVIAGATARMVVAAAAYYLIVWLLPFGAVPHPATGWLAIVAGVLAGLAFGVPLMAYAGSIEDDKGQFALVQRFIFMPMFLFSGTFFPLDLLPDAVRCAALAALPLTHVVEINRAITLEAVSAANLLNLAWIAVATAIFCNSGALSTRSASIASRLQS